MPAGGQAHFDGIAYSNLSTAQNDAHDAGFAYKAAVLVAIQDGVEQT